MKRTCLILFIVFVVMFIWGNSVLPNDLSHNISNDIMNIFGGEFWNKIAADGNYISGAWLIRKVAHFTLFSILGIGVASFLSTVKFSTFYKVLCCSGIGLSIPVVDETIQRFNDRNSSGKDIFIDILGFIAGLMITTLAIFAVKKLRKRIHANRVAIKREYPLQ